MKYQFYIDMVPVPKARPRLGLAGHVYTPTKTRYAEDLIRITVKNMMRKLGIKMFKEALRVDIVFSFKNRTKDRTHHTLRPDVDNLCKTVMDALNGALWKDDSQICQLLAAKVYCTPGTKPGIDLTVHTI